MRHAQKIRHMNQNSPSVRAAEQDGANARASRRDEAHTPWNAQLVPINACTPRVAKGDWYRLPLAIDTKLLLHCLQLRLSLSDLTMDRYIHEWPLCQRFADLEGSTRMSDESTILLFSHPRKAHHLGDG